METAILLKRAIKEEEANWSMRRYYPEAATERLDEKPIKRQMKYVEENIAIKKQLGKDTSFEEGLLKECREYLPGGSKHHLLGQSVEPTPL